MTKLLLCSRFRSIPRKILRANRKVIIDNIRKWQTHSESRKFSLRRCLISIFRAAAIYGPVNGDHSYLRAATNGALNALKTHAAAIFPSDENGQAHCKNEIKEM